MDAKSRRGKELYDFSLSELIDEYKKVNAEGGRIITTAIELGVLDMKKDEIEEKIKNYNEYNSEIAKEFIKRFA